MAPTLILIGFMGSGKTAVGRQLARQLGWSFADADHVIEQELGTSISEVFATAGEAAFRKQEETVVLGLLDQAAAAADGSVVSLGGGAVTIDAVRERLSGEPLVVLLQTDLETAYARARGGSRPLAADEQAFRQLYDSREQLYRSVAKIMVDVGEKDIKQVAAEVARLIMGRKGKA